VLTVQPTSNILASPSYHLHGAGYRLGNLFPANLLALIECTDSSLSATFMLRMQALSVTLYLRPDALSTAFCHPPLTTSAQTKLDLAHFIAPSRLGNPLSIVSSPPLPSNSSASSQQYLHPCCHNSNSAPEPLPAVAVNPSGLTIQRLCCSRHPLYCAPRMALHNTHRLSWHKGTWAVVTCVKSPKMTV
jgi:hypothetical protein